MKQIQLMQLLSKFGFQEFVPACCTWKRAYVYQFDAKVLVVLVRRMGVDLRFYDNFNDQIYLNKSGKLALNEGYLVRYSYNDTKINVHRHIAEVANNFTYKIINPSSFISAGSQIHSFNAVNEKHQVA